MTKQSPSYRVHTPITEGPARMHAVGWGLLRAYARASASARNDEPTRHCEESLTTKSLTDDEAIPILRSTHSDNRRASACARCRMGIALTSGMQASRLSTMPTLRLAMTVILGTLSYWFYWRYVLLRATTLEICLKEKNLFLFRSPVIEQIREKQQVRKFLHHRRTVAFFKRVL
jgi:hypothetical protein